MFRNRIMIEGPQQVQSVEGTTASTAAAGTDTMISLQEHEREYINQVLHRLHYNYSETARRLGVSRSTLWRKIKEYGFAPE